MFKKLVVISIFLISKIYCVQPNYSNKIALITGASKGIGLHLAKNLLERGIEVVGIARTDKYKLDKSLQLNKKFHYLSLDLTNENDLKKFQKYILENSISFDYVIHNAGIIINPDFISKMSLEDIEKSINLNLMAPIKLSKIISNSYKKNCRILNITSRVTTTIVPQHIPYSVSKAGINIFTFILKKELKSQNIAVACVVPGEVDTQMQQLLRNSHEFKLHEKFQENFKNKKLIKPLICADFLSWLLCDTSFNEFNSKQEPWDIYEAWHHKYWLKESLPKFPFNKN